MHERPAEGPPGQAAAITPVGQQALQQWLNASEPVKSVARDGLLLKLFFGAHADAQALRAQVDERRRRAERQLAELEAIERDIDVEEDFFPYLTLLHGLEDARSTIAWAERALAEPDRNRPRTESPSRA